MLRAAGICKHHAVMMTLLLAQETAEVGFCQARLPWPRVCEAQARRQHSPAAISESADRRLQAAAAPQRVGRRITGVHEACAGQGQHPLLQAAWQLPAKLSISLLTHPRGETDGRSGLPSIDSICSCTLCCPYELASHSAVSDLT